MTADRESMEMQAARAEIYLFFAGVFREPPTREFIENLLHPSGIEILAALFPDHPALAECRQLAAQYQVETGSLEDFQYDFENLMRIPGGQYIHPFESVYRQREANNRSPRKSMLMGEQARQVARIYQAEGLAPVAATSLFPDELSVELEFMGRLCRRAAAALELNEAAQAAEASHRQNLFLSEHLLRWAGACLEKVTGNAETSLYRILAQLLASFLKHEEKTLEDTGAHPMDSTIRAAM